MAECASAAVVSQYSQLQFVDCPHSPPLPPSVVECRGGRSGYAVNRHSQLRFNVKVPPRSAHMAANFPPRPSPVVIEKGTAAMKNTQPSVSIVSATAHNVSTVSQSSLQQSRSKVLMSDGLALASWLAKRDLKRNRLGALAALNAGHHRSDMDGEGEEEEEGEDGSGSDLLEDGPSPSTGRDQYKSMQAFQAGVKVEGRPSKGMNRNVHFDTITGLLASNTAKRREKHSRKSQGRHPASALLDVQPNTNPLNSMRHKSAHRSHIASPLGGSENSIVGRSEEGKEEGVYDAAGVECHRLHKQLLGQFGSLEGVLRRSLERGGVEGRDVEGTELDEEEAGRRRARGEEQLVRSSRTVYNLKQQLQELVKELDKYHSTATATRRMRKAPLVQQLLSLYRSSARTLSALIRTATQLRPAEAAAYTKHLSQCREVCGAFKQLACASLELGVGSQKMTDEVVKRTEALSSFVQELVQQQHRDLDRSGAREAALPLDRFDQDGRPPKGKNEGKNTAPFGPLKGRGGRRRQPPSTKPRGVILPPHLRRRIEQREERSSAAHPAPASSNWSKETFSFWLKKHLQQPDPGHRSKATRETPHFATVGSHGAVSSSAVSETVLSRSRAHPDVSLEALHHQCARQLKQNDQLQEQGGSKQLEPPFPSPSHTSAVGKKGPSEQDKGEERTDEGGGGVGGDGRKKGELGAVRGVEGAPISSPAWKLMAKELARQIWLDREVLSREAPKCSEDKPGGSGVGQREQVSSGSSVYVEDEIATEGGESGHVNHFGGGEGLRDGAFGGGEEMDGRRVEVSSEEVGRRAQLLMDRPALETMLLRLQEIEEERSRLCHKWSHITYEDPLVSGLREVPPYSRPLDATAIGGKELRSDHIVIEPVAEGQGDTLTTVSPASKVCPVGKDDSDSETGESEEQQQLHTPSLPVRTGRGQKCQRKLVGVSRALRSSVEAYQRQYQRYQQLTCTQAEGDFDPSVVIARVSEAILDDVLEELSEVVMAAGDKMAEELFSKEFARPDTPNDASSSTQSLL